MTDQELDKCMRNILIDCLKMDLEDSKKYQAAFNPSYRYQRQMRIMLNDPLQWERDISRPIWKHVLRSVAVVLLMVLVGFGGVMTVSPSARAAVIRWVTEWYETYVIYQYHGEQIEGKMPRYEITELPEGYTEVERIENPASVSVLYADGLGSFICLDYTHMQQGGMTIIVTDESEVMDITVNGMKGQLFLPNDPENTTAVTWIDTVESIQFKIDAAFDELNMLYIAESVSSLKRTK